MYQQIDSLLALIHGSKKTYPHISEYTQSGSSNFEPGLSFLTACAPRTAGGCSRPALAHSLLHPYSYQRRRPRMVNFLCANTLLGSDTPRYLCWWSTLSRTSPPILVLGAVTMGFALGSECPILTDTPQACAPSSCLSTCVTRHLPLFLGRFPDPHPL